MSHFIYCCAKLHYAECHYAECPYAECRGALEALEYSLVITLWNTKMAFSMCHVFVKFRIYV